MRRAVLPATVLSFPLSIAPALATPAAAQSPATRVSVRGTVLDPSRAPIAGMYGNKRVTADVDRPLNDKLAFRVNGMFEDSGSFRDGVDLKRHGITPTLTWVPSSRTTITARYEYLDDSRGGGSRHHLVPGQARECPG